MAETSKIRLSLYSALFALSAGVAGAQTASGDAAAADPADTQAEQKPGVAGGHSQVAFIAAYDTDGDGKVGLEELITARTERLTAADKDGDGKYNEAEYVAEFEARLRQQYADQKKDVSDEHFAGGLTQAAVRFALLDRDRDAFVTLEEDLTSARKTMTHNDTDKDGFVTVSDPKPPEEDDGAATPAAAADDKAATSSTN